MNTERIAFIREAECIGCTKCIQACPVDAIVGAAQLMHTVIKDLCIGCDLCVPPCPVDCIDMLDVKDHSTIEQQKEKAKLAKQRFQSRKIRLKKEAAQNEAARKKRIAEFKASPEASDIIKRAMEKAAAARSGRSDAERQQAAIEKLESKLKSMREELAMTKTDAQTNAAKISELENRIKTWEQKLRDHQ
jgi:Na+-translocating ferredoxin:NAD+ oxidoreductase subunit B